MSSRTLPSRAELGARAIVILRGLVRQVESRSVVRLFVAGNDQLSRVQLASKRVLADWHELEKLDGTIEPSEDWAFCEECGGSHRRHAR